MARSSVFGVSVAENNIVCLFSVIKKEDVVVGIIYEQNQVKLLFSVLTGQKLEYLLHLLFEADVEYAVGLVNHQALQIFEQEVVGVLYITNNSQVTTISILNSKSNK